VWPLLWILLLTSPQTGGPWTLPALPAGFLPPLDAALYNSTEGKVYFFKGVFYTRATLIAGTPPTFGPYDPVVHIATLVGSSFPFDWSSLSAAGHLPGAPGVAFFINGLQVVIAAGNGAGVLPPGVVQAYRSSSCQLCLCSAGTLCSPQIGVNPVRIRVGFTGRFTVSDTFLNKRAYPSAWLTRTWPMCAWTRLVRGPTPIMECAMDSVASASATVLAMLLAHVFLANLTATT
jgi:hypothetical protein